MRLDSTLLYRFVRSTSSHHRPWQIAIAITAGALIGILPKTSILIVLVGLICFAIPAHLPLLALTAVVISFATPLLHSTLGRVGLWSLTHPSLSAYWMRLDTMPLVPWLGIHNTVVNGSIVAWIVASVPIYLVSLVLSRVLIASAIPNEYVDSIPFAGDGSRSSTVSDAQEIRPLAGVREPGSAQPPIEPPVVIWDDINHDQSYFDSDEGKDSLGETEGSSSDQVIRRAAEMTAWAEELISEELLMDDRDRSHNREASQRTIDSESTDVGVDDEERWLIETTMEMVRIAEQAVTNQAALKAKQSGDTHDATSVDSLKQENFEIQSVQSQDAIVAGTSENVLPELSIRREQMPHSDHRSHLGHTRAGVTVGSTSGVVNRPREEALHYLLRHLKGVQEKAQKQ